MKKTLTFILLWLSLSLTLLGATISTVKAEESPEMKEGMRLFYEKNFDRAKDSFHEAFKKEPANTLALLYLLDCYAQMKNLQPILNELEESALENPTSALAKAQVGMGYFAQSLLKSDIGDEAFNQFQEALKIDNNLAMGYTGMGIVYYRKRMIPRSRSYFSKAIKLDPSDVVALERLGEIFLIDDRNFQAAQNLFDQIIELYPSYPDGYFYSASASKELSEYDKAIEKYEKTMQLDPLGTDKGHYAPQRIGDIYYTQKNFPKAVEYYQKSLKIDPENSYSRRMLESAKNPPKDEPPKENPGGDEKNPKGGKKKGK